MIKSIFVVASLLALTMFIQSTNAGEPCTVTMIREMIEQGLTDDQIEAICSKVMIDQDNDAQIEGDIYSKAQRLYVNQQFDDMIKLLRGHCEDNLYDVKANVLLANAYLELVEQMKDKGDKGFKELVNKRLYSA